MPSDANLMPDLYGQAWDCYFGDHNSIRKPTDELLASVLTSLCSDKDLLREYGERGRQWTLSHFPIRCIADRIFELYRSIQQPMPVKGSES